MAGDEDVIRPRLGDAGRDGADAGLRHQLHPDARAGVDRLQVVDELRQILDRIDVVVGRGRDELHPRLRMAQARDEARHLDAGKLPSFAGLGALRDLDLQLVGSFQVGGGHAEPRRGDLLDLVVPAPAVAVVVCQRVLAALT